MDNMKLPNLTSIKYILIIFILILLAAISISNYTACGCGGCSGVPTLNAFTLSPNKIIKDDQVLKNSQFLCSVAGCGVCTKYYYFKFIK